LLLPRADATAIRSGERSHDHRSMTAFDGEASSIVAVLPLAVASGVLYALAFVPGLWIVAWVALVPLLIGAARTTPQRAGALGVLWAVVAAYGVGWWFPGMIEQFFATSRPVSALAFVAASIASAGIHVGLFAAWVSWLARRRMGSAIAVAAGWMVVEWVRGNSPWPNPWALSAYSQMSFLPLVQMADLAGPYGIGFVLALGNAVLAASWVHGQGRLRLRRNLALVMLLVLVVIGYGVLRLGTSFGGGAPVDVSVVQAGGRVSPAGNTATKLARYEAITREMPTPRPAIVVWPEHTIASYLQESTLDRRAVLGLTRDLDVDLILGGPRYAPVTGGVEYFNSAFLVRNGRLVGGYDKRLLLPFAERSWVEPRESTRSARYSAGGRPGLLRAAGLTFGSLLCWESMYPDLVGDVVRAGADAVVNISNDDWFDSPGAARIGLDMARLRAVETRRFLVRAAATGISAVVDPYGRVVAHADYGRTSEVITAAVQPSSIHTPYVAWGDLCVAIALVVVAWRTARAMRVRGREIIR
jgi:apolipoprotein N-acyltransferase